ncbi:MAG: dockerin type I repeat-containing protein [Ruminococcus sp.]|nr:dockerin type I repeat-containing protein [Ruminococcus sp.]
MFKKFISVLLAVMMIASVMAVGVVTGGAATTDGFTPASTKLYFDVEGTGWTMGTKNKVAFHIFGGDLGTEANPTAGLDWGTKKAIGTATSGESGVFEVDPAAKLGLTLTPGVQYKIIFARTEGNNWTNQTYDLLFTTDCLGHIAYCDGSMYENPVDSSKKTLAAFWKDMDASEVGPVLQISSIGNVVGTCPEAGKTPSSIFADFLTIVSKDSGTTGLVNARKYVVDVGTKTEQQLIDDIGAGLGLTKDDVKAVFEENTKDSADNDVTTTWSYEASTLPSGSTPTEAPTEAPHVHTPGQPVQENVVPASCSQEGSYDEVVYCTECQEEISREQKTIDKLAHTPGEPVQENVVPASCSQEGSYDEVVYCTECQAEISREQKTIDKLAHTPGEPVQENVVPASCEADGSYDEVIYCTECQAEISREQKTINKLNHNIVFVEEVPATATANGVAAHYECTNCHKLYSDATGSIEVTAESLVIKAEHARGDANSDGDVDVMDATAIQRYLIDLSNETFDEVAADADMDGVIDIIDATLIQRIDAGMTTFEEWDAKHAG